MSHVLTEEIKSAKEGNNLAKQRILRTVIAGKVVKKYRCAKLVSNTTGLCRNRIGKVDGKSIDFDKIKRVQEVRRYTNDVITFLERDDNSRSLPGKADKIKTGKTTTQKRTLTDYLSNLHCTFLSENPSVKLSLASFCRIRPKYILPTSFISRNSCLCTKHQNMALVLKAIRRIDIDVPVNPETLIKDPVIDRIDEEMMSQEMKYEEWRRVAVEEKGEKKMIMRVVQVTASKDVFINHLRRQTSEFSDHVSRMRTQYQQIRLLKDKLPVHHAVVHMDFAENYNCKSVEEIQSAYWNQTSVTLHRTVIYTRKTEGEDIKHQSLVLVSDELSHNATTVVKDIVETVKDIDPNVKMQIHYWTDGPTSQYRNKTIFNMVANHEDIFGIKARWNFFEAGHGKGPCDGLGGTTKRMADLAMKSGRAVIQDANDFYAWTKSEICSMSNVKFSFVSKESCERTGNELKNSNAKPIKGTMKVHAVVGLGSDVVCVRDVSCYCDECLDWNLCSSWKIESTASLRKCDELNTNPAEIAMDVDVTAQAIESSTDHVNNDHNSEDQINFQIDDFVAALYDGKLYVGRIVDHDPEDGQFPYHISFMERKKDMFQWPKHDDLLWCGRGDIFFKVENPMPSGKSGRMFTISNEDLGKIENL